MKRFFRRDFRRTEHDDFVLNVQPSMTKFEGATPQYTKDGEMVGWTVAPLWE